jgi:hypothetical protein
MCAVCCVLWSVASWAAPFDESVDLDTLATWQKEDYVLRYVKAESTIIDRVRMLEELDPSMAGSGMSEHLIVDTKIEAKSKETYRIAFSIDPSMDPHFSIYRLKEDGSEEFIEQLPGLGMAIPGNGCLYTWGHTNNYFNERRKYRWEGGKPVEAKQPFYYAGLKTKTLKPVVLHTDRDYKEVVTRLPAGAEVEVVLGKDEDFLIKTPAGLLGWISFAEVGWIEEGGQAPRYDTPIEGVFYAGD